MRIYIKILLFFLAIMAAAGLLAAAPHSALAAGIPCPGVDGANGLICGMTSPWNMGTAKCDLSGSDRTYDNNTILGGQTCAVVGGGDYAGFGNLGPGNYSFNSAFPLDSRYPGEIPPGWTYAKTPFTGGFTTIPSGEFSIDPNFNVKFYGGTATVFLNSPIDDRAFFLIGSHSYNTAGCNAKFTDVTFSGCPDTGKSGNSSFLVNPGDSILFGVNNILRPNNGSGLWGTGSGSISLDSVTQCYTKAEITWLNSIGDNYQNVTDYDPGAAPGTCVPRTATCSIISFNANPAGPLSTPNSGTTLQYTVDAAHSWSDASISVVSGGVAPGAPSGSGSSGSAAVGSLNPGTYTYKLTCGPASQTVTVVVSNPQLSCSPASQDSSPGQAVNFTASLGSGSGYAWSAPGSSNPSGNGASFSTSFNAPGTYSIGLTDSANDSPNPACSVTVAPAGLPTATLTVNGSHNITVHVGDSINASWFSNNGDTWSSTSSANNAGCPAQGPWLANSAYGNATGTIISSQLNCVYTLTYTVSKSGNQASDSVTINVVSSGSYSCNIKASPNSGSAPLSGTLSWGTTGFSSTPNCTASGSWSGSETPSGSQPFGPIPAGSYNYTLSCVNGGESAVCAAPVSVQSTGGSANLVAPASVNYNTTANLSWTTSGVDICYVQGSNGDTVPDALATSNHTTPALTAQTTYTLFCRLISDGTWISSQKIISVVGAPGGGSINAIFITPASGNGLSQIFKTEVQDTDGGNDIYSVLMSIGRASDPSSAYCTVEYIPDYSGATGGTYGLGTSYDLSSGSRGYGLSPSAQWASYNSGTILSSANCDLDTDMPGPTYYVSGFSGSGIGGDVPFVITFHDPPMQGNYTSYLNGVPNTAKSSSNMPGGFFQPIPLGVWTVGNPPPGAPGSPTNVQLNTSAQCLQATLTWNAVAGATSYNAYRYKGATLPNGFNPLTQATKIAGATSPFVDNLSASGSGTYWYWVTAVGPGGESSPAGAQNNGQGVSGCNSNLSNSAKNIIALNGTAFVPAPGDCSGTQAPPAGTSFALGNTVTFKINICNNGVASFSDATSVVVVDQLNNLQQSGGTWSATLDGVPITPVAAGAAPNQTLTFNVGTVAKGTSRTIIFTAQIGVPSGFVGDFGRFQNSAQINYIDGSTGLPGSDYVYIPPTPFSTGVSRPSNQETAP